MVVGNLRRSNKRSSEINVDHSKANQRLYIYINKHEKLANILSEKTRVTSEVQALPSPTLLVRSDGGTLQPSLQLWQFLPRSCYRTDV